jgi:hypothetical protein
MKHPLFCKAALCSAAIALLDAGAEVRARAAPKPALEAARRQDFTGGGTFHRAGMLREQDKARRAAESRGPQPGETSSQGAVKPEAKPKFFLFRWLSRIFKRGA